VNYDPVAQRSLDGYDLPSVKKVKDEVHPGKLWCIGLVGPTVNRMVPVRQSSDKDEY
jgi:hypothetical protein